ncbi:hypothetical protein ACOSQ2_003377 [Xanthoceras sorbifolium]
MGQANYMQQQRSTNDPFSNRYNPEWRQHPNFGWRNNQNTSQQPHEQNQYNPPPKQAITLQSGKELGEVEKEVEVEKEFKEKEDAPQPKTEISQKVSPRKKILKEKDKPAGCSNSGHCDLLARPTACTHNSLKNRTKQLRRARPPDHATNSRRPLSPDEN